jgi:polyisoprenyl-phosphate glycosyltransferase
MKPFISVLIPAYNEEKSITPVLKDLKHVMKSTKLKHEIIVINDCSKDKTAEILSKTKEVKALHNPYNLGYGASLKRGIKEAKGTHILISDADGTYPIKDIPRLVELINKFDMVVGARTGKHVKIPLLRRPAKFFLKHLANFLTSRYIPDLNSGLRVFKKSIALEFFNLFPSGFSFTTTITLACLTNNYTVKYIPINYYKRSGTSTIHPIKDFIGFTALIGRVVTYFKPFRIFSLISFMLFLAAFAVYVYSFMVLGKLMDLTVIVIFLASLQVFLFGLIADLIVKGRK